MREEKQKIKAMMIFEIIGRPPQHLVSSLNGIIDQMGAEENVNVKSRDVKEPRKMEENAGVASSVGNEFRVEQNEFYITFAEVELETDDIFTLTRMMFKYMPAHIEVISPEIISVSNGDWGDLLSELIQRLHAYDEVARVMQVEKASLESQLKSFLEPKGAKGKISKEAKSTKKSAKKTASKIKGEAKEKKK